MVMIKKKLEVERHKLLTRRDFIAHGLMGAAGVLAMPSLVSLFASSKEAKAAAAMPITPLPVMIVDLMGGANIAGSNVIIGGQGGQLDFLKSYDTVGLPYHMHPSRSGMINNEFGINFHSDSGFLRGMLATTSPTTRAKIDGVVFACQTGDDMSNPSSPLFWLNKAGSRGDLSDFATDYWAFGAHKCPQDSIDTAPTFLKVDSITTPMKFTSLGLLDGYLSKSKNVKILQQIRRNSADFLNSLPAGSVTEVSKRKMLNAYDSSAEYLAKFPVESLDPRLDPHINTAFKNLDYMEAGYRITEITAAISKMLMDGHSGVGGFTLNGFDYHTGNRADGERRDYMAGTQIGQVLEYAALKEKDVVIYVFTDGGVSSSTTIDDTVDGRGKLAWFADSGNRSAALMLVYRHAGRVKMRNQKRQVGWYLEGAGAPDRGGNAITSSATNVTKCMVANYLALLGREGELKDIVGNDPFGSDLDQYLAFDRIDK